jgi:hypothetical protein
MDRELDLRPLRLEQVHEITNGMLRLRDRETVAGNDDYPPRAIEQDRELFGGRSFDLSAIDLVGADTSGSNGDVPEEYVAERPVHRPAHDLREDDSGRADE